MKLSGSSPVQRVWQANGDKSINEDGMKWQEARGVFGGQMHREGEFEVSRGVFTRL